MLYNKTKFMLLSHQKITMSATFTQWRSDREGEPFQILGIWLLDNLTWSKHTFAAKHGDFSDTYISHFSPLTVLLSLFCIYIKPKFFPYSNIWMRYLGPTSQKGQDTSRERLAIRIATKSWSSHNSNLPYELLSLELRRQYHKLLYTFPFVRLTFFLQ